MGAVFALFAGFYFWAPKIVGKTYNEFWGKVHFWTLFLGVLRIEFNSGQIKLSYHFKRFWGSEINTSKPSFETPYLLLSQGSILDIVNKEIIDDDSNDISDTTLKHIINNQPKLPIANPKKGETKLVYEKLNNIPAEKKIHRFKGIQIRHFITH